MTSEELQNVFYSGYPAATAWDVLDGLLIALDRGAVVYRSEPMITKDTYRAICDSIVSVDGLGPQEKGHMALKQVACDYLYKTYQAEALSETYFIGLHPDIRSANGQYIIECGTTDPSCVSIFLDEPKILWIGNISYPFADETNLVLHIFSRGDLYYQWRQESVSRNRAVFEKFHRK
ncbi:MAG: hypothetical protein Q8L37_05970 [Candidatus Gottesmanbacteria bacterium]|nr:hypothetical protein [Candidatus Gottesmanbacteria bacterium]